MIKIANLSFRYGNNIVFSNLNLSLAPGGVCGLLGKNGAGKTTLLKLMAGLLFPMNGDIRVAGRKASERSVGFLQDLFFLPEVFDLPPVTPLQYEKLYSPFYPGYQRESFREYLRGFDVSIDTKLSKISFGQKKKFLIAFGLATGCRLVLMDEPTNGLDISSKSGFRKAVASCLSDDQVFIIATHQVRDLESLIDPVIILDQGSIIFNHSMEAVSNRLKISYLSEAPEPQETLFFEKRLGGYISVTENHDDMSSSIDLETLFNCVVGNRRQITKIFQKEAGT